MVVGEQQCRADQEPGPVAAAVGDVDPAHRAGRGNPGVEVADPDEVAGVDYGFDCAPGGFVLAGECAGPGENAMAVDRGRCVDAVGGAVEIVAGEPVEASGDAFGGVGRGNPALETEDALGGVARSRPFGDPRLRRPLLGSVLALGLQLAGERDDRHDGIAGAGRHTSGWRIMALGMTGLGMTDSLGSHCRWRMSPCNQCANPGDQGHA